MGHFRILRSFAALRMTEPDSRAIFQFSIPVCIGVTQSTYN